MKFGIFYEHQLPRPWDDDSEHRLLKEALEQVELADRLGIDYVWEVEHHFLEEYSHSSAPEVFLAAASQRTSRIRLGHGIVQLPFNFNHTARVAERIATLDLVSGGRVEFGTGESSSRMEIEGFGVEYATKREAYLEGCREVVELARRTDGCLDFAISADPVDPARVNILERWESHEAVEAFRGDGPSGEQQQAIRAARVAEYGAVEERVLS